FQVLIGNTWSSSNVVTFDGVTTTAFADIDGLVPETIFVSGETEINTALTLTNTSDPTDVVTTNFRVRRPPIILVHGYASNGGTWTQDFLNALAAATPSDFIWPISYGISGDFNTWGSFAELVPDLDAFLSVE